MGTYRLCVIAVAAFFTTLSAFSALRAEEKAPVTAYDAYVTAGQAVIDSSDEDNNRLFVVEDGGKRPADLPLKAAYVQKNIHALTLIRQALTAGDYQQPPLRDIGTLCPSWQHYRSLARLLVYDSQLKDKAGDCDGAIRSALEAVRLGVEIPHGDILIGGLVGVYSQSYARQQLWYMIEKFDARQARETAQRISVISKRQVTYADILAEEKGLFQRTLAIAMEHPEEYRAKKDNPNYSDLAEIASAPSEILTEIKSEHARTLDLLIARSQEPYNRIAWYTPIAYQGEIAGKMLPSLLELFCVGRYKFLSNDVQNDLLVLSLVLQAYKLEHQAYPGSLAELSPTYLPSLSHDPFTDGKPYHYARKGNGYLLYSVGPDGVDNKGKPIVNRKQQGDEYYAIHEDSKGDIVAGTNITP